MTNKEMDKLIGHFDRYLGQSDCTVFHPTDMDPHIDILLYAPTDKLPYWKLVTMGASDYRMPVKNPPLGDRNEYVMFVDAREELTDRSVFDRYAVFLMEVAHYPVSNRCYISYGHSVEWAPQDGEEMICAFLELPQVIDDPGVVRCRLGLLKTAICLQVVLLTREETDRLLQSGPEQFSSFLYPEDGGPRHFICELRRSERF